MIGKGVKRPLASSSSSSSSHNSCCGRPDDRNNLELQPVLRQPNPDVLLSRGKGSRRKNAPAGMPPPTATSTSNPYCCGCRRWKGSAAAWRVAGLLGLHFFGFMACPCRGFTPAGRQAPPRGGGALLSGRRTGQADRVGSGGGGCRGGNGDLKQPLRAHCQGGGREARSGPTRLAEAGRYRPRDRKRATAAAGGGFFPSVGGSAGVPTMTLCQSTLIPSTPEEGRGPLGLLYNKGLLLNSAGKKGATLAGTTATPPARSGDKKKDSAIPGSAGAPPGTSSIARCEEGRGPAVAKELSCPAAESSSSSPPPTDKVVGVGPQTLTARWANVVNRAAISEEAPVIATQGAPTTTAAATAASAPAAVDRKWSGKDWTPRTKDRSLAPPGPTRKWTAKVWSSANSSTSWRAGEVWSGPRETTTATAAAAATAAAVVAVATSAVGASVLVAAASSEETSESPRAQGGGVKQQQQQQEEAKVGAEIETVTVTTTVAVGRYGSKDGAVAGLDGASGRSRTSSRSSRVYSPVNQSAWVVESLEAQDPVVVRLPKLGGAAAAEKEKKEKGRRKSWRVWCGPLGASGAGVAAPDRDICATAREELTVYLLATGATHYEVAEAGSALIAVEPELALTGATWRRWRKNLEGLRRTGFTGADVAHMLSLCPQLLALDFEGQVKPSMELLRQRLGMRPTDVRRVMRKAPEVLAPRADGSTAADAVDVLRALGLQTRHLRLEALRWPQLLAVPPSSFFQLAAFLCSEEVGVKAADVGSLIRQAPWLVLENIDGQMLPAVKFLTRVGVTDLERVVRAYPKILCASIRGELAPRVRFLWGDVGVSEDDLPRVLQTFPLLFAVPLSRMRDVVDFLSVELTINDRDVAKIIRAFPSLLGLERERHMVGVVQYLKQLGVQNVGRFVSRLPPVLGYDVATNLTPKMNFLVEVMGLSVYDVLTFPAYFSYPLQTVIEPRTEFLSIRRRPVTLVGLNIALQSGDSDFARKVAKVRPDVYTEFKQAYLKNRDDVRDGEIDPETLLSEGRRKALGNLGGQSTSNNVAEVTARATGLPPKRPKPPNRKKQPPARPKAQQQRQGQEEPMQ